MAYPNIDAPYGLKPVNLIGGQVFAGSTRNVPIAYNYATPIYYGDLVTLGTSGSTAGYAIIAPTNTSLVAKSTIGVFLGCYYTLPVTKQRIWAQFYPGNITSGDVTAIICDDPDTVFKAAVVTAAATPTISSVASGMVGLNLVLNTPVGNGVSGLSGAGLVTANATTAVGSGGAFRVLSLVPDTQISTGCTFVSTTTTSFVVSGLSVGQVIPAGTDIFQVLGGQPQQLGFQAVTASATTVTTTGNTTLTMTAAVTTTPSAGATIALVQTPEVLVKLNFGVHNYYAA